MRHGFWMPRAAMRRSPAALCDETTNTPPGFETRATSRRHLTRSSSVRPGATVLDLGVGGGRTAGPLSKIASCYVGLDYSQGMVAICRARDPRLELHHGDATDLSRFENRHFDAVVFLATGVDYIRTDEDRVKCLREV